jgi:hypothetical protein
MYEDPVLKQAALQHIPVKKLQESAASKMQPSLDLRYLLLLELLA